MSLTAHVVSSLSLVSSSHHTNSMAACSSSRALSSSSDHCSSSCATLSNTVTQPALIVTAAVPRYESCGDGEESRESEKETFSPVLCERGCPFVNGICPISEAEWRQAVLDKEAAASSSADEEKHAPVKLSPSNQERRKWQRRAIILYAHII